MITLRKMTQDEYDVWAPVSIAYYAAEHVRAGNWTAEEAPEQAKKAFDRYLPKGRDTEGHYVCSIVSASSGEKVGQLWYCVEPTKAGPRLFIVAFEVDEAHRRKGYGAAALKVLETEAARLGVNSIRLHVFGDNAIARRLYATLGYRETDVQMLKAVSA